MELSVIVPTYNRHQALERCVRSLQNQTLPRDRYEIIVIDDGSQPDVRQIEGVRVLRQPNQGCATARNVGAELARGRFLVFTDDDCQADPRWLEELLTALQRYPEAVLGGTTLALARAGLLDQVAQRISQMVYDYYNAEPENARFFASNNLALARCTFLTCGGFDGHRFPLAAEDRELCDRLRFAGVRLIWWEPAVVYHWPQLTLRRFCGMYFRYGRAAAHYQQVRALRGSGTILEESAFHLTIPKVILGRLAGLPLLPSMALCAVWQICNLAGFVTEKWRR